VEGKRRATDPVYLENTPGHFDHERFRRAESSHLLVHHDPGPDPQITMDESITENV
jgi:hypothetical protein